MKKILFLGIFFLVMFKTFSLETESTQFVKKLGIGYNWGNTMEAPTETLWGAPISTKKMFENIKENGFDVVRIPVAWSNNMKDDYLIDEKIAKRVQTIVDYAIDSDLYVILNIHWDGGWINNPETGFSKNYDECMRKYLKIWEQIIERYKNYDEHLIFESLNEEGCFDDLWNRYSNAGNKKQAFDILNNINQSFVDLVRDSSDNNKSRYLLIAGYGTDVDLTCDKCFRMPEDELNRCMVSIHYYIPSPFAIITEDTDWAKSRKTWGTSSDINELNRNIKKIKETFQDKGVGVIIGEYGCPLKNKDEESVYKYLTSVAEGMYNSGFCPVLWAGATDVYNRRQLKFDNEKIGEFYKNFKK